MKHNIYYLAVGHRRQRVKHKIQGGSSRRNISVAFGHGRCIYLTTHLETTAQHVAHVHATSARSPLSETKTDHQVSHIAARQTPRKCSNPAFDAVEGQTNTAPFSLPWYHALSVESYKT